MLPLIALVALAPPLRVFHVGNSVTDTIRYPALQKMAASGGQRYAFGRHMIPGAPLAWLWDHPNDGFFEESYGRYPKALGEHTWDVLTLQPFDRHLDGSDGDLAMARKFIDLALPKSPDLRVYVYQRWPRRDEGGALDYPKKYGRAYTGGWDGTEETASYFSTVLKAVREAYPARKNRIHLVPVGDVVLEIDKRAKAGKIPGIKSAVDLYVDGIHFGDTGAFVVGSTFYATLFRKSPAGLSAEPYGVKDPNQVKAIQEAVWDVVTQHPEAGLRK